MTAGGPRERIESPSSPPASTSLLATLNALGRLDGSLSTTGGDAEPQVDDGTTVVGPQSRWPDGVEFDPDYCDGVHLFDPCDWEVEVDFDFDCPAVRAFDPYIIDTPTKRSTLDRGFDLEGQARRLLARCQHGAVGGEFWSGDYAAAHGYDDNGYLADGNAELVADGDSLAALDALAALEEGLAGTSSDACGCGARGMIHASPTTVTIWGYQGVVTNVNGLLVTTLGTVVATGPGYTGTGPADSDGPIVPDEGFAWAYATGMPAGRLGPVSIVDHIDQTTNVRELQAERPGMVVWDGCCHLAVLVDHSQRD